MNFRTILSRHLPIPAIRLSLLANTSNNYLIYTADIIYWHFFNCHSTRLSSQHIRLIDWNPLLNAFGKEITISVSVDRMLYYQLYYR